MAEDAGRTLDLDALAERRVVRIKRQDYPLLHPAEMSILDLHQVSRLGQRLAEAMSKDAPSEKDVVAAREALEAMCRIVLKAPDEIQRTLTDSERDKVAAFFLDLQREDAALARKERGNAAKPSTGAS